MKELNSYKNKLCLIHTRNLQRKFSQMHLIAYYCQNCEQGGVVKDIEIQDITDKSPSHFIPLLFFPIIKK